MKLTTKTLVLGIGGFLVVTGIAVGVALNFDTIKNGFGSTVKTTVDTTISTLTPSENEDVTPDDGTNSLDGTEVDGNSDVGESSEVGEVVSGSVDGSQSGIFRETDKLRIYTKATVGNAVLVESNKQYMLVDTGDTSDASSVISMLAENGVTKLKYLVISNYHKQSVGTFQYIIENYDVDYIILSDMLLLSSDSKHILPYLESKRLSWSEPKNTTAYYLGSTKFHLITPSEGGPIVTVLSEGVTNTVLLGSTSLFEGSIISQLPSKTDLVVLTQPASNYFIPQNVLDRLKPTNVIFNNKALVSQESIDTLNMTGATLYQTSTTGNINIGLDGNDVNIILNAE